MVFDDGDDGDVAVAQAARIGDGQGKGQDARGERGDFFVREEVKLVSGILISSRMLF